MSVNQKMTAIADEVRTLAGVADKLSLDDMATHTHDANTEVGTQENLIEQIRTALQGKSAVGDAEPIIQPLEVTENGTYTAPDGVDGYSPVTVNVPIPSGYIKPSGTKDITENGTHDVTEYASVNVNVPTGGSVDNGVLPIGYTPVPSIKFTGEQAVDTGIICNQDTQIRTVFTADEDKACYIYGVASGDNTASLTAYRSSSGGRWRFGNQSIVLTTTPDAKIVWGVNVNKSRILRCNISSTYGTVNDFETTGALVVGGGRLGDGTIEEATRFIGKFIAFEIYDGDELVLSFVPCKNADGVCGFWDTVSEQFFTTVGDTPLQWSFV